MTSKNQLRTRRMSDSTFGFLLMVPALLVLLVVIAFPILKGIYASFCDYGLKELRKGIFDLKWNNFANYKIMLQNNQIFTYFKNTFVGKSDKNQAFTPDHICDFMSKAVGVNKNSRVLDPCCGSGAFLVRAMTDAMDDCDTEEEREEVKKNQIFGIEYEEGAFGLSSTNMLIHGDGNSNVVQDSMFKRAKWIAENNISIVLMNPPYNATKKCCDPDYTKGWDAKKKEDPSKGLHFVEWVARHVPSTCKMAVLLPMQAAIGNSGDVKTFKKKMLDNYTLDAVFSLPTEMFYPGAAAIHFPTNCREVLWATRPQVTKVAMLGYNFIPTWDEQLRANLAQSKNKGNRKTKITST